MDRQQVSVVLFVVAGIASVLLSVATEGQIEGLQGEGQWVGFAMIIGGMVLVLLSLASAGAAFHGAVEPVLETLVTTGPYGHLRHPVYLGLLVALAGVALTTSSLFGVVAAFSLFLPALVYRAYLEEQALARKFGDCWYRYKSDTFFLLPGIW